MFYKKGSYVLYNNNIYKALKDTTGDISCKLQLKTSASFLDRNNIYKKVIGTDSNGINLVTEPTGNYKNTTIDLGNVYNVTKITLSDIASGYCQPGETVIETSADGTSYIEANSCMNTGYFGGADFFKLNINEKARYIKIVFKSVYKPYGGIDFDFRNVSIYTSNIDWQKITNTYESITEWKSGNTYTKGELVLYDGAIYKCINQNNDTNFSKNNFELAVYDTKIQPITNEFIDTLFEGLQ